MNRRRFLKYAGATAATIGISALGADFFLKQPFSKTFSNSTSFAEVGSSTTTVPLTSVETTSTEQLTTLSLGENDLGGYVFHDYNGNGILDGSEPVVDDVEIVAEGYYATVRAQPSHGLYVFRNLPKGSYRIYPVHPQDKFRYMCRSNQELVDTRVGYRVDLNGKQRLDMALMEGFLTLPAQAATHFEIDRFYDWDPDPSRFLWWNGESGPDNTKYVNGVFRGYSPNHSGIDYYMPDGNPLPSPAPGKVRAVVEDDPGGKYILIDHLNGFFSSCGHISRATVSEGDLVARGQTIAISGKSGQATELANYPHNHFQVVFNKNMLVDPYRPIFKMSPQYSGYYFWSTTPFPWISVPSDSNPNMRNLWTKDNDPQYPLT